MVTTKNNFFGFYSNRNQKFLDRNFKEKLKVEFLIDLKNDELQNVLGVLQNGFWDANYTYYLVNLQPTKIRIILEYTNSDYTARKFFTTVAKEVICIGETIKKYIERGSSVYLGMITRFSSEDVDYSKITKMGYEDVGANVYEAYDINFNYRIVPDEHGFEIENYSGRINSLGLSEAFFAEALEISRVYNKLNKG